MPVDSHILDKRLLSQLYKAVATINTVGRITALGESPFNYGNAAEYLPQDHPLYHYLADMLDRTASAGLVEMGFHTMQHRGISLISHALPASALDQEIQALSQPIKTACSGYEPTPRVFVATAPVTDEERHLHILRDNDAFVIPSLITPATLMQLLQCLQHKSLAEYHANHGNYHRGSNDAQRLYAHERGFYFKPVIVDDRNGEWRGLVAQLAPSGRQQSFEQDLKTIWNIHFCASEIELSNALSQAISTSNQKIAEAGKAAEHQQTRTHPPQPSPRSLIIFATHTQRKLDELRAANLPDTIHLIGLSEVEAIIGQEIGYYSPDETSRSFAGNAEEKALRAAAAFRQLPREAMTRLLNWNPKTNQPEEAYVDYDSIYLLVDDSGINMDQTVARAFELPVIGQMLGLAATTPPSLTNIQETITANPASFIAKAIQWLKDHRNDLFNVVNGSNNQESLDTIQYFRQQVGDELYNELVLYSIMDDLLEHDRPFPGVELAPFAKHCAQTGEAKGFAPLMERIIHTFQQNSHLPYWMNSASTLILQPLLADSQTPTIRMFAETHGEISLHPAPKTSTPSSWHYFIPEGNNQTVASLEANGQYPAGHFNPSVRVFKTMLELIDNNIHHGIISSTAIQQEMEQQKNP